MTVVRTRITPAISVDCPTCGATVGLGCHRDRFPRTYKNGLWHVERVVAAKNNTRRLS